VTQARSRSLYERLGMPDSAEGRFEMIVLHLALALRRLAREGDAGAGLRLVLTETFVVDIDDSLREMTVGDLSVPRQVKRAVAVLRDRYAVYAAGLEEGGDRLASVIRDNLGALRGAEGLDVTAMRTYIEGAARNLDAQAGADILAGRLHWLQV
jgi:cytochrome b pre-mRNA-processing protein 3